MGTNGEVPAHPWSDDSGWALTIEAFPNKPQSRDQIIEQPLGMFFEDTMDAGGDDTMLMRALKRKHPGKYGDLPLPYVVAVNETLSTPFDPTPHRTNVLFGEAKLVYGDGLAPHWIRAGNRIWRGPGDHPRNRRLAAVLFASNLTPWHAEQAELEWWDNPFASHPVPDELLPDVATRRQLLPDQAGEPSPRVTQPARTPGSVLLPGS